MASTLAFLPFRVVHAPTACLGRAVAWLAEGYRTAPPLERALIFPTWAVFRGPPLERALIFPTWAVLRGLFIVGLVVAHLLHESARRSLGQ